MKEQKFGDRFLHFTETVIYSLAKFYFMCSTIELAMCAYALYKGMDSALTTFITESNTTFRETAGVAIVKFLVENIFQYNQFFVNGKKLSVERKNPSD